MASGESKSRIQKEILEIVTKLGFWMMQKNGLDGCAGYIHTPNRKIYAEVLFPSDYPRNPIVVNIPRDLRQHPTFQEFLPQTLKQTTSHHISAFQVLNLIKEKITSISAREIKERLIDELDEELNLVKSIFNVKIVAGKKYHIRIFYQLESQMNFEIEINYKDYPKKPQIIYHHDLGSIIGSPQGLQVMQRWNTSNPPHIVQIVQEVEQRFTTTQGIEDTAKLISVRNLTLVNDQNQILTHKVSFSALKGDIIGVYCLNKEIPLTLFKALSDQISQFEGEINIFGKLVKGELKEKIELIDFDLIQKDTKKLYELSIEDILKKYAKNLPKKDIKNRINKLFSIIGLSNRRKMKFEELSEGERRRVIVAFSIINLPNIIIMIEPEKGLNATEKKRIWDTIIGINDMFSSTIFIYSSSTEIKRCHNILVLSREGRQLGFGTLSQLINELPLLKEVIVVQLKSANPQDVETIGRIPGLSFMIEERHGEKYRLFTTVDPNRVIPQIFQQIGMNIYNIRKHSPSLIDYVPYKRVQRQ